MRILRMILTAVLLLSLNSCGSLSQSDHVIKSDYIISNAMVANEGTTVDLGGKTFQVKKDEITWDRGGSLRLPPNWGLLELYDSPDAIAINLDGVKLADVAK